MGVASILQRTRICTWPVITSARPSCRKRRISSSSTTATAAAIPVFYCYWYYCCYAAIATARLLLLLLLLQLLVWPEYAAAVTATPGSSFRIFSATFAQTKSCSAGCRPTVAAQPGYQRRTPVSLPRLAGHCHPTIGALWRPNSVMQGKAFWAVVGRWMLASLLGASGVHQ